MTKVSYHATICYTAKDGVLSRPFNYDGAETETLHKGDIVRITTVRVLGKKTLCFRVETVPHALTRGIGAFQHESIETGQVQLKGKLDDGVESVLLHWFKVTDTPPVDKLSNTAGVAIVKEVKQGMSFAEVESVLGLPATRVDLDSKVIYKYKDLTIEFHDGKVADVR